MNLSSIFSKYPTQEACIEHLETVRWDDNPTCPYCKSDKVARKNELDKVGRWNCHFPGVEITASGGIHVLGILDTNSVSADVATLLGPVGYQGQRGASEVAAELAPLSVVEAVCNAGGIPLLAHVDGPPGAWGLKGNTLTSLLDFSGLFAMEVVDLCSDPPELYRQRKLAWSDVIRIGFASSRRQYRGAIPRLPLHVGQNGKAIDRGAAPCVTGWQRFFDPTQRRAGAV